MQMVHLNMIIALPITPKIVGGHKVNEIVFTQHVREAAAALITLILSQKVQETIMIVYWPYGAC